MALNDAQALREFLSLALCYGMSGVSAPVELIRRDNLALLIKRHGSQVKFAEHVGKSTTQLSQWINRSIDPKTKKPRNMSGQSCREIETALRLDPGWMDERHPDEGEPLGTVSGLEHSVPLESMRVPITFTARADQAGGLVLDQRHQGGAVGSPSGGERSFGIRVVGDALHPLARHGQVLVCDPGRKVQTGRPVLLEMTDGSLQVRELLAIGANISTDSVRGGDRQTYEAAAISRIVPIAGAFFPDDE